MANATKVSAEYKCQVCGGLFPADGVSKGTDGRTLCYNCWSETVKEGGGEGSKVQGFKGSKEELPKETGVKVQGSEAGALAPRGMEELPVVRGSDYAEIIQSIEAQAVVYKRQRQVFLKITTASDWLEYKGGYCRMSDGALSKFKTAVGLIVEDVQGWQEDGEDKDGRFIDFYYSGWGRLARLGDLSPRLYAIGSRSTRDPFFKFCYDWNPETKKKDKKRIKALNEIDLPDVRKAALTNLKVNLMAELLGLKNVPIEELKSAGVDIDRVKGVQFA